MPICQENENDVNWAVKVIDSILNECWPRIQDKHWEIFLHAIIVAFDAGTVDKDLLRGLIDKLKCIRGISTKCLILCKENPKLSAILL